MPESSLLQEIEEDLQRQRFEKLWKQYGNIIIAFIAAMVLATALFNGWRSWRVYTDQKATAGLLTLAEGKADSIDDKARQIEGLEAFARAWPGASQSTLARLQAAQVAVKLGKTEQAVGIYDELAKDEKAEPAFRQLGDLLAVEAQLDSGDPAALKARLAPLLAKDGTWRPSALELSALLDLRAGDKEGAKKLYTELSQDTAAPASLTGRANDMLRWLNEGT